MFKDIRYRDGYSAVAKFLAFKCKVKFDERLLNFDGENSFSLLEQLVKYAQTAGNLKLESKYIKA